MYEIETNEFINEKNRSLEYVAKMSEYKGELQLIVEELDSINMEGISQSLLIIADTMQNELSYLRMVPEAMARIEECYSDTEDDVIDNIRSIRTQNGNRYGIGFFNTSYGDIVTNRQLMNELVEMIH